MDLFGIKLSELDLWLLGAAGMGLAWLIPHRLALSRERRSALHNAAAAFRAAFGSELATLRELRIDHTGQVCDILCAAYPAHEAAYQEFERNLDSVARQDLGFRWLKYRGPYPLAPELPTEDRRYRLAHFIGTTVEEEEVKRVLAIALITALTN